MIINKKLKKENLISSSEKRWARLHQTQEVTVAEEQVNGEYECWRDGIENWKKKFHFDEF